MYTSAMADALKANGDAPTPAAASLLMLELNLAISDDGKNNKILLAPLLKTYDAAEPVLYPDASRCLPGAKKCIMKLDKNHFVEVEREKDKPLPSHAWTNEVRGLCIRLPSTA